MVENIFFSIMDKLFVFSSYLKHDLHLGHQMPLSQQ